MTADELPHSLEESFRNLGLQTHPWTARRVFDQSSRLSPQSFTLMPRHLFTGARWWVGRHKAWRYCSPVGHTSRGFVKGTQQGEPFRTWQPKPLISSGFVVSAKGLIL